jgi:hypothetical protein
MTVGIVAVACCSARMAGDRALYITARRPGVWDLQRSSSEVAASVRYGGKHSVPRGVVQPETEVLLVVTARFASQSQAVSNMILQTARRGIRRSVWRLKAALSGPSMLIIATLKVLGRDRGRVMETGDQRAALCITSNLASDVPFTGWRTLVRAARLTDPART